MSADALEAELERVHGLLRRALRDVGPEHWPPRPWHAGGPRMECPTREMVRIALWCADLVIDRAPEAERAEVLRIKTRVDAFLSANERMDMLTWYKRAGEARPDSEMASLDRDVHAFAQEASKKEAPALVCARRAAAGAAAISAFKADTVHASCTVAVRTTARELLAEPRPLTVSAFLGEVDQRMMRGELVQAARKAQVELPLLVEVRVRAPNDKDQVAFWIAEVEGGGLGLFGKFGGPRGKWAWIPGPGPDLVDRLPAAAQDAARARLA